MIEIVKIRFIYYDEEKYRKIDYMFFFNSWFSKPFCRITYYIQKKTCGMIKTVMVLITCCRYFSQPLLINLSMLNEKSKYLLLKDSNEPAKKPSDCHQRLFAIIIYNSPNGSAWLNEAFE